MHVLNADLMKTHEQITAESITKEDKDCEASNEYTSSHNSVSATSPDGEIGESLDEAKVQV